jgi:hypothetical protein
LARLSADPLARQKPMTDEHRKPTGDIGPISIDGPTGQVQFHGVEFPSNKEAIERFIAFPFTANAHAKGWFPFKLLGPPEQNPTDHFDFTLRTSAGIKYLELMEVHLRDIGVELPTGQFRYNSYEVARCLLDRIQAKSNKYQGATSHGVILLTYATHWQFCLDDCVYWLLGYWLKQSPPMFEMVFDVSWLDPSAFQSRTLFPSDKDFSGFEPERFRDNHAIPLNPKAWEVRCDPEGPETPRS